MLAGSIVSKKIECVISQDMVESLAEVDYVALCNRGDTLRHVLGEFVELLRLLWIDQYAVDELLGETLDARRTVRCENLPEGGAGRVYLRDRVGLQGLL